MRGCQRSGPLSKAALRASNAVDLSAALNNDGLLHDCRAGRAETVTDGVTK